MKTTKLDIKHYALIGTSIAFISLAGLFAYKYYMLPQNNNTSSLLSNNKRTPMQKQNARKEDEQNQQINYQNIIDNLPKEDLSEEERNKLIKMLQEEKLAHDVYVTLGEKWDLQIFFNISNAETKHQQAIETLLTRYNIENPVKEKNIGEFQDEEFTKLYNSLVEQGSRSEIEALKVGATIEDLDINDLDIALSQTNNQDIKSVYEFLKSGSENHLRAFIRNLKNRDTNYQPQYISEKEFNSIIQ